MADPQSTYYPGPDILATVDVGRASARSRFSFSRQALPQMCIETGACVLRVVLHEHELVALRDLLSAVIADAPFRVAA